MTRVLVVDDEVSLARALVINLRARKWEARAVGSASAALDSLSKTPPDVIILDLGLPDMDGMELLRGLRSWSRIPVIVLSARTTTAEKVAVLELGADDYVTKPFEMNELMARVRAAARRGGLRGRLDEARVVATGGFTVDLATGVVERDGTAVQLTPTEWHVLEVLAINVGRLVEQNTLLAEVWGKGYEGQTQYLRVYLGQLRKKLEPDPAHPRHLITQPGLGYRLVP